MKAVITNGRLSSRAQRSDLPFLKKITQLFFSTADCHGRPPTAASLAMTVFMLFLSACKPTYKKETLKESVQELAKKEYKIDVDVAHVGTTLGARFRVPELLNEMYSGNDDIYKKMNGLFTILARVGLSSDVSPEFIVLDIIDEENPKFQLMFTRHMLDVRKSMAEALSTSQSQDRLIQEFVVGGKRVPIDPEELDLVRIMMMAADIPTEVSPVTPPFLLREVRENEFLSRVIENTAKRIMREKRNLKDEVQIRNVIASFPKNNFQLLLDLAARPKGTLAEPFLQENILPVLAQEVGTIFKSYRFNAFSDITVLEKNSGARLTLPAR